MAQFLTMQTIEVQILNDDYLLRRVPFQNPNYIKADQTLTSYAFQPRKIDKDGLSVDVEKLTSYEKSIQDPATYRLYKIRVEEVKNLGFNCQYNPSKNNPAHALIIGNFNKNNQRQLAQKAIKINYPTV